jgi:hypothetical protein
MGAPEELTNASRKSADKLSKPGNGVVAVGVVEKAHLSGSSCVWWHC